MYRRLWLVSVLTVLGCASALQAEDTLTLKSGGVAGEFVEYKLGRFHFQRADGEKIEPMRPGVVSLELNPSAKVSVKLSNLKKREDLRLLAYRAGAFVFETPDKETLTMPASEVSALRSDGLDFARAAGAAGAATRVDGAAQAVDLPALVKPGVVTIIYIHHPEMAGNQRQGNYVETLETRHPGKVAVVKVEIGAWDSPTAVKYGIASAPQFWFHNRRGVLTRKLVDRFTEADIDNALKAALR